MYMIYRKLLLKLFILLNRLSYYIIFSKITYFNIKKFIVFYFSVTFDVIGKFIKFTELK